MKFTEAIAKLQKSDIESAKELAKFFSEHFKSLEENYRAEEDSYKEQLQALLDAAKGEGTEIGDRLESATKKIAVLNEALTKANEDLAAKQSEYKQLQRQASIKEAAFVSGANLKVLQRLIDSDDTIEVGEEVKINGKSVEDWAKANFEEFLPSLLPTKKDDKLPTGDAHQKKDDGDDNKTAVDQYMEKNYMIPSFLK